MTPVRESALAQSFPNQVALDSIGCPRASDPPMVAAPSPLSTPQTFVRTCRSDRNARGPRGDGRLSGSRATRCKQRIGRRGGAAGSRERTPCRGKLLLRSDARRRRASAGPERPEQQRRELERLDRHHPHAPGREHPRPDRRHRNGRPRREIAPIREWPEERDAEPTVGERVEHAMGHGDDGAEQPHTRGFQRRPAAMPTAT